MSLRRSALLLTAGLTLAARAGCANQPMPGENPTPARSQPAAPPPSAVSGTTAGSTGGTASGVSLDEGTATGAAPETALEVEGEADDAVEPVTGEARQAAIEDCYNYAWSQVAHDQQVQHDRAALFDESNIGSTSNFTERLDEYGNEKRRGQLFDNCMAAKGYAEGETE